MRILGDDEDMVICYTIKKGDCYYTGEGWGSVFKALKFTDLFEVQRVARVVGGNPVISSTISRYNPDIHTVTGDVVD